MVTLKPLTVQIAGVELANVTLEPDVSVAGESVKVGDEADHVWFVGGVHVMVWVAASTEKLTWFDVTVPPVTTTLMTPIDVDVMLMVATPWDAVIEPRPVTLPVPPT
jgi:hypothetical protein